MHNTDQDAPLAPQAGFNYREAVLRLLAGPTNRGLSLPPLLTAAGIDPSVITQPVDISRNQYIHLLAQLIAPLQDEFFGLRQRPVKPGVTSMMIEIALGNDTLGAAMTQSLRFMRLVCEDLRMELRDEDDHIALVLSGLDTKLDPGHFLVDYWLHYLHRVFSWTIDQLIPVKAVQLAFTEPVNPHRFVYQLRGDWQDGCDRNAFVFSRKYLSLPILRSRNEWLSLQQTAARSGVVDWPDEQVHIASRVRSLIFNALRHGEPPPSLGDVAQELHLTTATLHRHLNSEATSFQRILNDVRCDTAIDKLRFQKLSVAEVAEQLGFSEPRSFSRAFKQWTGANPSDYQG